MSNAAPLFGLAAIVSSLALLVHVSISAWLRWRETEGAQSSHETDTMRMIAALQEQMARVERALEAQGTDLERLGEAQRYAARLLAERVPADADVGSQGRVSDRMVTPH